MEELTEVIDENGTVVSTTYADDNGQYTLSSGLEKTTEKINKLQVNMKKSLLAIAKTLSDIKPDDVKKCGFKNVAHYAEVVFGYKKVMTSNLIRIGTQYVVHDKNKYYTILEDNGVDFTVSQLQECLKLDVADVQELVEEKTITADMTCKEIREVVKELTTDPVEKEETEESETEESETEEKKEIDWDSYWRELGYIREFLEKILDKNTNREGIIKESKYLCRTAEKISKILGD